MQSQPFFPLTAALALRSISGLGVRFSIVRYSRFGRHLLLEVFTVHPKLSWRPRAKPNPIRGARAVGSLYRRRAVEVLFREPTTSYESEKVEIHAVLNQAGILVLNDDYLGWTAEIAGLRRNGSRPIICFAGWCLFRGDTLFASCTGPGLFTKAPRLRSQPCFASLLTVCIRRGGRASHWYNALHTPMAAVHTLVTGAAGFLGAHIVRQLLNFENISIVGLDDLSGGFEENIPPNIEFVKGSITDAALLERLFQRYNFRLVYHLAAYAAEGLSHFIRRFNYTNNLIGSVNLINEAVKAESECFVFTSSIAVYGAIEPPMVEYKTPLPEDPYGISKLAVEMDLRCAHEMFGLNFVVFRPHNVYGEYQNLSDPYRNVIGIFMKQILEDRPMTIFGDGTQQRAFSYVGDIAPIIARAPFVPAAQNEVFNVGADQAYTVNDLARHVANAMGKPNHPIQHLPPRNEVMHAFSDHSKARSVFGSGAQTLLEEGLTCMAGWARSVKLRPPEDFADLEVTKNMPPSWLKNKAQAPSCV